MSVSWLRETPTLHRTFLHEIASNCAVLRNSKTPENTWFSGVFRYEIPSGDA